MGCLPPMRRPNPEDQLQLCETGLSWVELSSAGFSWVQLGWGGSGSNRRVRHGNYRRQRVSGRLWRPRPVIVPQ